MFTTHFLDIPPLDSAAGQVLLPGSKSISNRVLLLAALSTGTTCVHDLLDSDDTRVMLDALRALGCGVKHEGAVMEITGLGGHAPAPPRAPTPPRPGRRPPARRRHAAARSASQGRKARRPRGQHPPMP